MAILDWICMLLVWAVLIVAMIRIIVVITVALLLFKNRPKPSKRPPDTDCSGFTKE